VSSTAIYFSLIRLGKAFPAQRPPAGHQAYGHAHAEPKQQAVNHAFKGDASHGYLRFSQGQKPD
jgi:hypothetical protein